MLQDNGQSLQDIKERLRLHYYHQMGQDRTPTTVSTHHVCLSACSVLFSLPEKNEILGDIFEFEERSPGPHFCFCPELCDESPGSAQRDSSSNGGDSQRSEYSSVRVTCNGSCIKTGDVMRL